MYENSFRGMPPVKVGDELDVKIDAIGEKGDGIAKKDGFVLVIPGTSMNDEVRIRVTKVLRRLAFADVIGDASASEGEKEEEADLAKDVDLEKFEDTEDFGEDLEKEED